MAASIPAVRECHDCERILPADHFPPRSIICHECGTRRRNGLVARKSPATQQIPKAPAPVPREPVKTDQELLIGALIRRIEALERRLDSNEEQITQNFQIQAAKIRGLQEKIESRAVKTPRMAHRVKQVKRELALAGRLSFSQIRELLGVSKQNMTWVAHALEQDPEVEVSPLGSKRRYAQLKKS